MSEAVLIADRFCYCSCSAIHDVLVLLDVGDFDAVRAFLVRTVANGVSLRSTVTCRAANVTVPSNASSSVDLTIVAYGCWIVVDARGSSSTA